MLVIFKEAGVVFGLAAHRICGVPDIILEVPGLLLGSLCPLLGICNDSRGLRPGFVKYSVPLGLHIGLFAHGGGDDIIALCFRCANYAVRGGLRVREGAYYRVVFVLVFLDPAVQLLYLLLLLFKFPLKLLLAEHRLVLRKHYFKIGFKNSSSVGPHQPAARNPYAGIPAASPRGPGAFSR